MMVDAISFLFGRDHRTLNDVDPTLTVLRWLREVEGRTGTKEGCAEGDCGACTVVLVDLVEDQLRYRAVNACILLMGQIHGCQLLTVDHLRREDGRLHAVQRALIEHHASQCGFCTPGFVMSLFALMKSNMAIDHGGISTALAGNLCRCTGYRPIVDAAKAAAAQVDEPDQFDQERAQTIAALRALGALRPLHVCRAGESLKTRRQASSDQAPSDQAAGESRSVHAASGPSGSGGPDSRHYWRPKRLDEAAELCLGHPDAVRLAGATDAGLWLTKQHRDLLRVIDLSGVLELKQIRQTSTDLEIGAAVTFAEAQPVIACHFKDFAGLIRRIGGRQVQNMGTIGGNIANGSPIGDSMPALIALDASLVLRRGPRERDLPLEAFYLGYRQTALEPGEFLRAVRIPLPPQDFVLRCYKVAKRFDQDISAVMAAFALRRTQDRLISIRIGFGGMAATPKRALAAERVLMERPWSKAAINLAMEALAQDFSPISDMRASAGYRLQVARNLLMKFYLETTGVGHGLDVSPSGAGLDPTLPAYEPRGTA